MMNNDKPADALSCAYCENYLSFGGASPDITGSMSQPDIMEMMAKQIGWKKKAKGWKCGRHKGD